MKKIDLMFMVFMVFIGLTSFSQDRVNEKLPIIGGLKTSLIKARGWCKSEGQWYSRVNRIPQQIESENIILIDYGAIGLGDDNFISYQTRDIRETYLLWYAI